MADLTNEQRLLLSWMGRGRTFRVCSDYCSDHGQVQPKARLPIQVHIGTIHKFIKDGLVSYSSQWYFGLRWDEFYLTDKGRAFTEQGGAL